MPPTFGLMIGVYIVTRMVELLSSDKAAVVKGFAWVTILVALISAVYIFNSGSQPEAALSQVLY